MLIRMYKWLAVAALAGCTPVKHNDEHLMWRVAYAQPGWSYAGSIDHAQDVKGRQSVLTVSINGTTAISVPMFPGYSGEYYGKYDGHDIDARCDYQRTGDKEIINCEILLDDDSAVTLSFS